MARPRGSRIPPLLLCLSSITSSHAFVSSGSTIPRQLGLVQQLPQQQCHGTRFASSRSRSKNSNSGSGNSFGPGWARDHRRRPRSGELKASPAFPPGRREGPPFSLHAVSSPALGGKETDGLGISASRDARQPQEDVKKVDKGRRQRSVGGVLRRGWSRVVSYLTIMTTWVLFRILLKGLNKVECRNREGLLDAVFERGDRGLLTVSNHMSVYDDPGLWSALVPFWRTGQKKMRWAMCTDDIYNASPLLKGILDAGKTLPIRRSRGMEQPLFKAFFDKLEEGDWGHIFAEGGIRQPWRFSRGAPILGEFKVGIGRLLLRSKDPPMVLPMYHIGMHQVAPEAPVHRRGRGKLCGMLPNVGRRVLVYVGDPIDVSPVINKCREKVGDVGSLPWTERSSKEETECHKEIAAYVREHVLNLEAVARREYYGNNPDACPYSTAE